MRPCSRAIPRCVLGREHPAATRPKCRAPPCPAEPGTRLGRNADQSQTLTPLCYRRSCARSVGDRPSSNETCLPNGWTNRTILGTRRTNPDTALHHGQTQTPHRTPPAHHTENGGASQESGPLATLPACGPVCAHLTRCDHVCAQPQPCSPVCAPPPAGPLR